MRAILPLLLVTTAAGCQGASEPGKAASTSGSAASAAAAPAVEKITGARAKTLVAGGALLVDVRSPSEFADGHVTGARNVPVDTVGTADLGPKDAAVVVYCHSGRRSARAAEELTKRGYTNVKDLGGMDQWDK